MATHNEQFTTWPVCLSNFLVRCPLRRGNGRVHANPKRDALNDRRKVVRLSVLWARSPVSMLATNRALSVGGIGALACAPLTEPLVIPGRRGTRLVSVEHQDLADYRGGLRRATAPIPLTSYTLAFRVPNVPLWTPEFSNPLFSFSEAPFFFAA